MRYQAGRAQYFINDSGQQYCSGIDETQLWTEGNTINSLMQRMAGWYQDHAEIWDKKEHRYIHPYHDFSNYDGSRRSQRGFWMEDPTSLGYTP